MSIKLPGLNVLNLAIFLLVFITAGCLGKTQEGLLEVGDDATRAEKTARGFFEALHAGEYQVAVSLYGGSYQVLADMNPDLDPTKGEALLAQGCNFNGFTCLRMGEVLSAVRTGEGEYTLTVHFQTEAGEIFVLGPCCGADETEMPPVSEFTIRVAQDKTGKFKVLDLPPYVP